MKQKLVAGVVCSLAFIFVFAGFSAAQGGELVAAQFGLENRQADVTQRVRSLVRDGMLHFEVNRHILGVDPAPERVKYLVIRVRHWDGNVQEYSFREHSLVNLEIDPERGYDRREWEERREERREEAEHHEHHDEGVRVIRAYYGAEGQFINVTETLRRRVDDGRLYLRVDDNSMGGDPLPGRRKWLRVLYFYNGERRNAVVEERGELRLP